MKYQFNRSKLSSIFDKKILTSCYHRSNQGDGEFHQIPRMRY